MLNYPSSKRLIVICYECFRFFGGSLPFLLPLKLQLQRISKLTLGWDAQIPEQQREAWERLIKGFPKLSQICVLWTFQGLTNSDENQLHVFVNASNSGIDAICYLRAGIDNTHLYCENFMWHFKAFFNSLYGVKRFVVAVRLAKFVQRELDL